MAFAMAREERHRAPVDLTDDEGVAGLAERSGDLNRLEVVEEVVEPGAPDDSDLSGDVGWRENGAV